jgi:hypothetical protein
VYPGSPESAAALRHAPLLEGFPNPAHAGHQGDKMALGLAGVHPHEPLEFTIDVSAYDGPLADALTAHLFQIRNGTQAITQFLAGALAAAGGTLADEDGWA